MPILSPPTSSEQYRRRLLILGALEVLEEARSSPELSGHELLFASGAAEAAERLAGNAADLVVCPAGLDGGTGIALARSLDQGGAGTPRVVLLIGSDEEERAATEAACQTVLRDAAPWAVIETLVEQLRQLPPPPAPPPIRVEVESGGRSWSCQAYSLTTSTIEAVLPEPLGPGTAVKLTLLHRDRRLLTLAAEVTAAHLTAESMADGGVRTLFALSSLDGPEQGLARALLRRMIRTLARGPGGVTDPTLEPLGATPVLGIPQQSVLPAVTPTPPATDSAPEAPPAATPPAGRDDWGELSDQGWSGERPAPVPQDDEGGEPVDWMLSDMLPGLSLLETTEHPVPGAAEATAPPGQGRAETELSRRGTLLVARVSESEPGPRRATVITAAATADGTEVAPQAAPAAAPRVARSTVVIGGGVIEAYPAASLEALPADLVARYAIDRKLADLRFGPVHAVTHRQLQKSALLMTTPAGFSPADVERYLADLREAARIDQGTLLKPWDVGRSSDGAAFAVYLATWRPLATLLGRAGGASAWTSTRFIRAIADALAAVHERGLVHGALSPDAVLLERLPHGEELPRLFGFGAAGLLAAAHEPIAPPGYLAPELMAGGSPTARSDVYGLGALLFALLTGRDPGAQPPPTDPAAPRLPAPSSVAQSPGVAALDEVVLAATQVDPARRPGCSELGQMLDRAKNELVKQGAHDPLVGTVVAGRYRILGRISSEPLGVLYRAQHAELGTRLTIKVLPEALRAEPALATRFINEARAASAIGHPTILDVYDVGELGTQGHGQSYFVTEELRGQRLSELLKADGRIELGRALGLARQITEGLQAAHRCLIVHRDLQPSAIQVSEAGGHDQVKILNFGLAKVLSGDEAQRLTRMGMVVGTPGYMAPEQAMGQSVDARADLYGLGVLLFEMISGGLPFSGPPLEALRRQAVETAPLLSTRVPHVPSFIDNLVARALAVDPERRYQAASELMAALDLARAQLQPTSLLSSGSVEMPSLKLLASSSAPAAAPAPAPALVTTAVPVAVVAMPAAVAAAGPTPEAKPPAPAPLPSAPPAEEPPKVVVDSALGATTLPAPSSVAAAAAQPVDDGPIRLSSRRWPVAVVALAVLVGGAALAVHYLGVPGGDTSRPGGAPPAPEARPDAGAAPTIPAAVPPPAEPVAPGADAGAAAAAAAPDAAAGAEPKMTSPEQEQRALLGRARRQLKRRDYRGTLATLEKARQLRDSGTIRSLMAEAYRGLGQMKDAIKHQQLAIRREPRKLEHHLQLSRLHVGRGDVPAACRTLAEIYRTTRGNAQIRSQLARYACPEP